MASKEKDLGDSNRAERLSSAEVRQGAPTDWVLPPSSREGQGRGAELWLCGVGSGGGFVC